MFQYPIIGLNVCMGMTKTSGFYSSFISMELHPSIHITISIDMKDHTSISICTPLHPGIGISIWVLALILTTRHLSAASIT